MEKKKSYLKGAAILAIGGFVARFLGIFIKLPLVRILGDFGSGLYATAYPIYSFLLSVSIIGLPVAISKMVSERVGLGNYKGAYKVFRISLITLAVIGAVCSLVMFFGAKIFISIFKWHPDSYYSILGLAFAPFFVAIMSVFKGYFQGMQTMLPPSIAQIVESLIRVIVGLGLCIYFTNVVGSVVLGSAGATFGATAGALIAAIFLAVCFITKKKDLNKQIRKQKEYKEESSSTVFKILLKIAIPITLASLVSSAMNLINSVTVTGCLQNAGFTLEDATIQWGYLSNRVYTLLNVPMIFASSLAASLVPSISESFIRKERKAIKEKIALTIKVVNILSFPCAVGLCVLCTPITTLLFGSSAGSGLLATLAFSLLFTMMTTVLQSLLQGINQFIVPIKNLAMGCIIKYVFNMVLISTPQFNIYGAPIATYMAEICILLLHYASIRKHTGYQRAGIWVTFKTAVCAVVMGVVTFLAYQLLYPVLGLKIAVVIAIFMAIGVYAGLILLLKVSTVNELKASMGR